jgi:hypothetical protein
MMFPPKTQGAGSVHGVLSMIPAQWLPSLPPPADGWFAVYYVVSKASGILCQGEYRVDGDRVWARNDMGVKFLPREKHLDDVAVAMGSAFGGGIKGLRRRHPDDRLL